MPKFDKYYECRDLIQAAADFVCGRRPAGGPYRVEILDHPRHLTDHEAKLHIVVEVDGGDEGEDVFFEGEVPLEEWRKIVKHV